MCADTETQSHRPKHSLASQNMYVFGCDGTALCGTLSNFVADVLLCYCADNGKKNESKFSH